MDLHFNRKSAFTRWVVTAGYLSEPFVVIDIGVQGGENPRWHLLGDYLVVHGFDPIEEAIDALRQQNRTTPNRHYHWMAAGSEDTEQTFYFNAADPRSSSFYRQGRDRFDLQQRRVDEVRKVQVRRLDTLLREGLIPRPDFLKNDVEGLEKEVFLGAHEALASVLGLECETSFSVSPTYRKGHFATMQDILIEHRLVAFDVNFNRIPRASFLNALTQRGRAAPDERLFLGKPATFNVLFCRDPIDEADHPESYTGAHEPLSVEQLIKMMIIYELHGLNDIAIDTAQRFRDVLGTRIDVDKAVDLLLDPSCLTSEETLFELRHLRSQLDAMRRSTSWRLTAPLRAIGRRFRPVARDVV